MFTCMSRSAVELEFYHAASVASTNRPFAYNGSSYKKRSLFNFNVDLNFISNDVGWFMDVDYANCYYTCEIYLPYIWNQSGMYRGHD